MSTLQEIEAAVATLRPEEMASLEKTLRELREKQTARNLAELEQITGFHGLPKRNNQIIPMETVLQLCDDEGI